MHYQTLQYIATSVTLTAETGGMFYLTGQTKLKGLSVGGHIAVAIPAGFSIVSGYQFSPFSVGDSSFYQHYAYGGASYKIDDLKFIEPYAEVALGLLTFALAKTKDANQYEFAGHVDVGVNFILKHIVAGFYLRYLVIPTVAIDTPSGINFGLRLGCRFFE